MGLAKRVKVREAESMVNSNEAFSQFRQELYAHLNVTFVQSEPERAQK